MPNYKTLNMPGNAFRDPSFYDDEPTARGPDPDDNGNLGFDGFATEPKATTGGLPFKNLKGGK